MISLVSFFALAGCLFARELKKISSTILDCSLLVLALANEQCCWSWFAYILNVFVQRSISYSKMVWLCCQCSEYWVHRIDIVYNLIWIRTTHSYFIFIKQTQMQYTEHLFPEIHLDTPEGIFVVFWPGKIWSILKCISQSQLLIFFFLPLWLTGFHRKEEISDKCKGHSADNMMNQNIANLYANLSLNRYFNVNTEWRRIHFGGPNQWNSNLGGATTMKASVNIYLVCLISTMRWPYGTFSTKFSLLSTT